MVNDDSGPGQDITTAAPVISTALVTGQLISDDNRPGAANSSVSLIQQEQLFPEKEVAREETQIGIGDSHVSPAQPEQFSTPPHSDSELNNITVIKSEEDTSTDTVVTDASSSKSTLTSNLSSSRTDEEIAMGMVDPIITIIETINDPPRETQPETQRYKFIFFYHN